MRTWRTLAVEENYGLSATSGKNTFALPRTHMIGDIWLVLRATNVTAGNSCIDCAMETIEHNVDKIEVKSGSRVYKSYDGEMCRLLAAHHDGGLAPATKDGTGAAVQETVFHIPFGIEPQDEDVILPAPLLDSLNLTLEYSYPTVSTGVDTTGGFVSGSKYMDIYVSVLEPTADLEDKMILVQEKKEDISFTAKGETPFSLTLDERRLLRKVYVQAYVTGQPEGYVCGNLEFKVDHESVIKADWEQIQYQNAMDHKLDYDDFFKHHAIGDADIFLSRIPDVQVRYESDVSTTEGGVAVSGDAITMTTLGDNDAAYIGMHSPVLPTVAILDFDRNNSLRRLQPQGVRDLDLILGEEQTGDGQIIEESLQKVW